MLTNTQQKPNAAYLMRLANLFKRPSFVICLNLTATLKFVSNEVTISAELICVYATCNIPVIKSLACSGCLELNVKTVLLMRQRDVLEILSCRLIGYFKLLPSFLAVNSAFIELQRQSVFINMFCRTGIKQ